MLGIALVSITFMLSMTLIFIYVMFLVIIFIVCIDYMLSIVRVIIISMHRITECSTQCLNGLSSRTCVSVVLIHCFAYGCPLHFTKCDRSHGDCLIEPLQSTPVCRASRTCVKTEEVIFSYAPL
jgi:hypothetical protein